MSGIELSLGNIFTFISYISPFLVGFFVVIISFINQNIKGIIYLGGALIVTFITLILQKIGGDYGYTIEPGNEALCNIFNIGGFGNNSSQRVEVFVDG